MGYNRRLGVAQGGMVDTPTGDWYAFMFQDRGALGRAPVIMQMWFDEEGWPILGDGGAVPQFVAPAAEAPNCTGQALNGSDDFRYTPGEDGRVTLAHFWQFSHNSDDACWSVTERPGAFRMTTRDVRPNLLLARNTLTQRCTGPKCAAWVTVDGSRLNEGDYAGICTYQGCYGAVALPKREGQYELVMMARPAKDADIEGDRDYGRPPVEYARIPAPGAVVTLRADTDFSREPDTAWFSFLDAGGTWKQLGVRHDLYFKLDLFIGCRFGLFCYATRQPGGRADFLNFDIYKGLTFWSPNVNIFRDPRWGRGHETYGEDPYLTARMGTAYIRGLQGSGSVMKAAACAKHFAVHSGPEGLRHRFDAVVSPEDLEETYLPAFRACVMDGEVEAVMGAYNRTNGEPCCGSKTLLADIMRDKWGFRGHVVSDCWAVRDFHEGHGVTDIPTESVALALRMGCDLNCGDSFRCILRAFREGLVTEAQITTAAERLFTTRYLLGILEEPSEFDRIPYEVVECEAHLALAQEAARKSCVLLKNNGLLPLDLSTLDTIGVIGPNANSRLALVGNYHGTASRHITVLEGIQDAAAGHVRVLYSDGCGLCKAQVENLGQPDDRLAEAVTVAKHSNVVILALGLDETLEGEEMDTGNNAESCGDKSDLLLPASQRKLLHTILELDVPTVVLLMAGSAIDLSEAEEKAGAVLLTWYPGAGGGRVVSDLLFGKTSPSGKLPITIYRNEALDELPAFTDYSMRNRTYRYYQGTPLYPFGYGLTYGDIVVTDVSAGMDGASVTAENRGSLAAEDVIQLYIKAVLMPPKWRALAWAGRCTAWWRWTSTTTSSAPLSCGTTAAQRKRWTTSTTKLAGTN